MSFIPGRKYTKELLESVVPGCHSLYEVVSKLAREGATGGSVNVIRARIREYGISTSHFRRAQPNVSPAPKEVLVLRTSGPRTPASRLRKALIQSGIPHICSECENGPLWRGRRLVLQVDHKDGNWLDDRIENLRFLCPNCHSQTDTFGSVKDRESLRTNKGHGSLTTPCKQCGNEIRYPATRKKPPPLFCGASCLRKDQSLNTKASWPDDKTLSKMVNSTPVTTVAKVLGVSGTAVAKRCKRRGIPLRGRGYWTKKYSEEGKLGEPAAC